VKTSGAFIVHAHPIADGLVGEATSPFLSASYFSSVRVLAIEAQKLPSIPKMPPPW
jgi:hypothetical protein